MGPIIFSLQMLPGSSYPQNRVFCHMLMKHPCMHRPNKTNTTPIGLWMLSIYFLPDALHIILNSTVAARNAVGNAISHKREYCCKEYYHGCDASSFKFLLVLCRQKLRRIIHEGGKQS